MLPCARFCLLQIAPKFGDAKQSALAIRFALPVALLFLSSSAYAEIEGFPPRMRGFWADKKTTCDILKTKGPSYLRQDQTWLRITATGVLGSTQGRFFRKVKAEMLNGEPAEFSALIQTIEFRPIPSKMEYITLSFDGHLYESIVGARAEGTFRRC